MPYWRCSKCGTRYLVNDLTRGCAECRAAKAEHLRKLKERAERPPPKAAKGGKFRWEDIPETEHTEHDWHAHQCPTCGYVIGEGDPDYDAAFEADVEKYELYRKFGPPPKKKK